MQMIAKGAGTPPEENICQRKDMWKGRKRVSQFPFFTVGSQQEFVTHLSA
jgi:hypothetical protein